MEFIGREQESNFFASNTPPEWRRTFDRLTLLSFFQCKAEQKTSILKTFGASWFALRACAPPNWTPGMRGSFDLVAFDLVAYTVRMISVHEWSGIKPQVISEPFWSCMGSSFSNSADQFEEWSKDLSSLATARLVNMTLVRFWGNDLSIIICCPSVLKAINVFMIP